ncbi:MAG: transcriptional regulator [Vibrio sp.]|uniref:helix-turn-helix domain-containing protein n=1 Tax=Vibrio sp. TaxID=678 RepID=UPI003A88FFF7
MQETIHDWHRADVKSALEKAGTNLSKLARENKIKPVTFRNVLRTPCPSYQEIVAKALNEKPENIWPSRYMKKTA